MSKIFCWLFGHKWSLELQKQPHPYLGLEVRYCCAWCGKKYKTCLK